ncbi:MAG: hypothetical protein HYY59_04900 [Candidatus Omnitrophica bacterium]|nr:hypothetical protein [Candidatus Omnitrophota bacterium]
MPKIPPLQSVEQPQVPRVVAVGFKSECVPTGLRSGRYSLTRLDYGGGEFLENYDIAIVWADGLASYSDLIIEQEKQIRRALQKGKTIALLFSFKTTFDIQRDHNLAPMRELLAVLGLRMPVTQHEGWRRLAVQRNEFELFLDRYGLAYASSDLPSDQYASGVDNVRADTLASYDKRPVARSLQMNDGMLIALPVHAVSVDDPKRATQSLPVLVDAILAYREKVVGEGDDWVKDGFVFTLESPLIEQELALAKKLEDVRLEREKYHKWKILLSAKQYQLQELIPTFLAEEVKFRVKRVEQYREDFWINDADDHHVAIGEVTSIEEKNVTKGTLGKLQWNRGQYELADDFPGILVVNTFSKKQSVKDKDVEIPPNVRTFCSNNAIIIIRTLDLVRIYDLLLQGKMRVGEIENCFLAQAGWLTVDQKKGMLCVLRS